MLTDIKTVADRQKLPSYVRAAIDFKETSGLRNKQQSGKTYRKMAIQAAARRAVEEGEISLALAIELLQVNRAYGPKGKKALEGLS